MPYPRKVKNVDYETLYRLYLDEQMSSAEIGKLYGVTAQPVLDRLKELNIPVRSGADAQANRSHKDVNEDFFSYWNQDMAYVLGWVLSDGTIDDKTGNLRISCTDEDVLHKIADVMGLSNGVRSVKAERGAQREQFLLAICRRKIFSDLMSLGVKAGNKTFDQPYINIPTEFERDFIRGFFDGDGSIVISNHRKGSKSYSQWGVVIVKASEPLVDGIIEVLKRNLDSHIGKTVVHNKNPSYRIHFGSKDAIRRFYVWLYRDVQNELWLDRKYQQFNSILGPVDLLPEAA